MHHIYPIFGGHTSQDGSAASLLFPYKQSIGSMIDGFIQSTENRLSQWFWREISSLPRDYFSKDITAVNYQDKSFWEGVFNKRIEELKEQWDAEPLVPPTVHFNNTDDEETVQLGKLKEQTAAGFIQGDLSLEDHLIQLQGMVGKNTLSPQCYESGLECLKRSLSQSYVPVIEETLKFFRKELKQQPELLAECFQGDVLDLLKRSQPLTWGDLQKIVDYYQPLMNQKHFAKYQDWLKSCYRAQSLLPPPVVNKSVYQQPPEKKPTTKKNEPRYWYSIGNISKFLWEHAGKLVTFGLAAQMAAVQATGSGKTFNLKCPDNTSVSSCIENRILGLLDLFDQMKNDDKSYNDQILPLAFEIKNIMLLGDYPSVSEAYRCELTNLKDNLPSAAVNLIWKGNNCTIKDIGRNEYLYAATNNLAHDKHRRRVFTWREETGIFIDNKPYWIFSTTNIAKSFSIKNIYFFEYLYAAANERAYDNFRRNIFTWRANENEVNQERDWVVRMNSAGDFEIRTNIHDEYLYAEDNKYAYDNSRRRVFTWDGPGASNSNFSWEIKC